MAVVYLLHRQLHDVSQMRHLSTKGSSTTKGRPEVIATSVVSSSTANSRATAMVRSWVIDGLTESISTFYKKSPNLIRRLLVGWWQKRAIN